jgi:mannose-1-phosphate guanylyltransferase/mannose-6-phosphate isomerase
MSLPLFTVVLSGGAGSRLWPLSTSAQPKQHHCLTGADTMLAETLKRVTGIEGVDRQPGMIIGSTAHAATSRETLERLGEGAGRVISEPSGKNTAPAAALACLAALQQDEEALVLLLPSDHHIGDVAAFRAAIAKAARHAAGGRLVAFGIMPTRPETGYGYIQRGEAVGDAFTIARFVEKPPLEDAEAMLAEGGYDWNAGIFLFHARTFLDELGRQKPDMLTATKAAFDAARIDASGDLTPDAKAWDAIKGDSIDYAVMQDTKCGMVVPVDMTWSDLGSFQTLWEMAARDGAGNAFVGDVLAHGASGNYVRADGGRPVAVVGCEDLVVVDTGKAVLVMPREKAQAVKQIVERLKDEGRKGDY